MPETTAEIKDLPVDIKATLTQETKKGLIKIVNDEFQRHQTVYNYKLSQAQQKVREDYQKSVGFDELVKEVDTKKAEVKRAENKLYATGLDIRGSVLPAHDHYIRDNLEAQKQVRKLREQLDAVTKALEPAASFKSKIITRLLVATTVGEAMVLLREVLGNDIIPTITKDEVATLQISQQ